MKILKRLCVAALCCGLFLCGSGFSNRYKDVQRIKLESNPSTGWHWEAQIGEYNKSEKEEECSKCKSKRGKVKVTRTFESDSKNKSICGAGGVDIFEIKGVKEGIVNLELVFAKDNNGSKIIDRSRTISMSVCVNESNQVKIASFYDSDWCCVNKK